jgi:hypothetical protein
VTDTAPSTASATNHPLSHDELFARGGIASLMLRQLVSRSRLLLAPLCLAPYISSTFSWWDGIVSFSPWNGVVSFNLLRSSALKMNAADE